MNLSRSPDSAAPAVAAPSRPRRPRRAQGGWSLLESVVVVALTGLMAVGLWRTLEAVDRASRVEEARSLVQRAEDALHGRLLRDHALPPPDAARLRPQQPQHFEGWLPQGVLAAVPPNTIRYLVDRTLVAAPAVRYRPDPMVLNGSGTLGPRAIGGLDVCLALARREQSNTTLSPANPMRLAFALRRHDAVAGPPPDSFVLDWQGQAAGPDAPAQAGLRTLGYGELMDRLGCVPAFARLATEVKAMALAGDLMAQADLNVVFRHHAVRATRESMINALWRIVNSSVRLATATWDTLSALVTITTTPMGFFSAGATLAGFAAEAATWIMLLDFSKDVYESARDALPGAEAALVQAQAHRAQLGQQRAWHQGRVEGFQDKGVLP